MRKKFLILFLTIVSAVCLCIGISACGGSSNGGSSSSGSSQSQTDSGSNSGNPNNDSSDETTGNMDDSSSSSNTSNTDDTSSGNINTHSLVAVEAKAATCTAEGNTAYWYCSECGKYFSDKNGTVEIALSDTVIAKTAHTIVTDESVAATCSSTGLTEGSHCSVCGAVIVAQEITDKIAHTYSSDYECDENGHWQICTVCGYEKEHESHTYKDGYCSVCGQRESSEGLVYTLSDDGTYYTISGIGTCSDTDVVIPSMYKSLPVKAIAEGAFAGQTQITSVYVPDSIKSIGSAAFSSCSGLVSITLPFVGGNADATEASASTLFGYIFDSTTYDGAVSAIQYYSSSYKIYYIPAALTTVEITGGNLFYGAFYGCTKITSITISDNIETIGDYAFYNCTSLTSVTIGDGVTSIGSSAFGGCSGLVNITLPFVGGSADATEASASTLFGYIFGTTSYTGGTSTTQYYSSNSYTTYYIPAALTTVTITSGDIYYGAFYNCSSLTNITIGVNVTSIGSSAFSGCSSLVNITLPFVGSSVSATSASSSTLFGYIFGTTSYTGGTSTTQYSASSSYTTYYIPATLTTVTITGGNIPYGAFYGCSNLTSVILPDGLNSIGSHAFYKCSSLKNIAIPDDVNYLGTYAFYNCSSLESIIIPDGVSSIGDYVFYGCTSLTSVTIPGNTTSIGNYAFYNCSLLESVTIPDDVTSIGSYAFYNCSSIESINIPDGVTTIGEYAFDSCSALTSVYITDLDAWCNVSFGNATANPLYYAGNLHINSTILTDLKDTDITAICDYNFVGWNVTDITVPDSVESIGSSAFNGCSSLESITLPFVGSSADSTEASALTLFGYIFGTNSYDGGTSTIQYYASGSYETYYIPATLTTVTIAGGNILYGAFYGCTNLTSMTISNTITSIGTSAFYNCTSLDSVYITDIVAWCSISFEDIYANPLYNASDLYLNGKLVTDLIITDGMISITDYAFYNCTSLTSVTIPESVNSIGELAFTGCTSLANITVNSANKYYKSVDGVLYSYDGTELIQYAAGKTDASFTIPDAVKTICGSAFYGCTALKNVTIPNSVTSIGSYAFCNCTAEIIWDDNPNIIEIGSYTFAYYMGTSITIPDSVTSIGSSAFYGCSNLRSITLPFVGGSAEATKASSLTLFGYIFGTISYTGGTSTTQYYANNSSTAYYIPSTLTSVTIMGGNILYGAFHNCSKLTSVIIGDNVTSIGDYAFYRCTSLTSVTIGDSVDAIGTWTFASCTSLMSVTV